VAGAASSPLELGTLQLDRSAPVAAGPTITARTGTVIVAW